MVLRAVGSLGGVWVLFWQHASTYQVLEGIANNSFEELKGMMSRFRALLVEQHDDRVALFWCKSGRHRSVAAAMTAAYLAESAGFKVFVVLVYANSAWF